MTPRSRSSQRRSRDSRTMPRFSRRRGFSSAAREGSGKLQRSSNTPTRWTQDRSCSSGQPARPGGLSATTRRPTASFSKRSRWLPTSLSIGQKKCSTGWHRQGISPKRARFSQRRRSPKTQGSCLSRSSSTSMHATTRGHFPNYPLNRCASRHPRQNASSR